VDQKRKTLALVGVIVVAVAVLLWSVLGRGDPAQPTAPVSGGSSPTSKTPDDPR